MATTNFSSLFFLTLLGLSTFGGSFGFPYHGQRFQGGVQRSAPSNDMGAAFGAQQIPPPQTNDMEPLIAVQQPPLEGSTQQQQTSQPEAVQSVQQSSQPETVQPVQQSSQPEQSLPAPEPLQQSPPVESTEPLQPSSSAGSPEPYQQSSSTDIEPLEQTPPAETVESSIIEPIDNETDSTQVIVQTLTEAERSHLISYFLCEMCKELQVSMCMRICNGDSTEGSGSGAEIEASGDEVESSGEGSGEDGGDTIIIIVEESSNSEGSGQESSNGNGAEASGSESSGFGDESEASGDTN
uniref:Uncharacterized protein n=1 Tax=Panagrolaimus superbus TaxID=310955 RepID=A0A914YJQ4_9BILA